MIDSGGVFVNDATVAVLIYTVHYTHCISSSNSAVSSSSLPS